MRYRRPVFAWLLLVLLVEMSCLLLLMSWFAAGDELAEITNLAFATPGGDWWIMAMNQSIFVLGIGFVLVWRRWYGALVGIVLFLSFLCLMMHLGVTQ